MTTTDLHIYFVLDRSGSMESMASDVVGGFNGFLADQQSDGADALMTLIQFDSNDSHEVLADALPIAKSPRSPGSRSLPAAVLPSTTRWAMRSPMPPSASRSVALLVSRTSRSFCDLHRR